MSTPAPGESAAAGRAAATLWSTGLMGRFLLLGIGVWLHAADSLVTATIAPAIVEDLGGIAYINWTISLYQVGAIVAGAAAAVLCSRWGIRRVFIGATLLYGGGCMMAGKESLTKRVLSPTYCVGVLISCAMPAAS